ncbi:Acyl-CoA synthetase (AMP-forming)/AMP-acid ligase II [Micromonospora pattaloongensis]|uniref:Acyl-CoA synthetase (AMP-forming)/AMP-acid ligase II n=1 Tax=Micromonospora pattaloongensis TaxID=405436 RepID=A0A1H3I6S2_9ACTN|nr:AMP-binding protein [Micromonospora pattaloongensis]SDY23332.1 Acyl-CoA synthetase (AMP-forming)/AMP-acid ligase II [Micromonospora pattaloongensis]
MDLPFVIATLARRGLLTPGSPLRVAAQLNSLRKWSFTIAGELRQAAARDPHRVALIDEQRGEITYAQLLRRAEQLARSLRSAVGIRAGDRIGVLCRNHNGLVETMVAATLLGADSVLVNTGLSAAQLELVAQEQELRALVHDAEFTERIVRLPASVERIDEGRLEELVQQAPPGQLRHPERDGRTIVLTSGTTGTPKGARRRTPSGFKPLVSIIDRIPLHAREQIMIAAPIFHTWGYAALQVSFALRATIVLQRRFEPAATLRALDEHRCTALFAVPVMLQRLLEVPPPAQRPPLKVVAVSGSALPGGLAPRFMDVYGDVIYNLYGSTEVSWASIATPADLRRAPNTAGTPPFGTRLAILDPAGEPVPAGQVGRIFVGNEMLFEGYTSGLGKESHDGLMATGDLGHLDPDGLLFVDGREDDMIISGGENVFPSEVENLLAELPQVREVAVIGVPDPEYGQRLAAYLALHPNETLDPDAVREYVRHYRARFCVPRDVFFVPFLPRNATGKVVTRDLPRPQQR